MPVLAKKWFREKGEFPPGLAKNLQVASFGSPVTQTLVKLGWDGRLIAGIGLELSPDNRHTLRGEFFLRGQFTREAISVQASNLWPNVDPAISLQLVLPDAASFSFRSGNLCSDLIACEDFKHKFTKGGTVILPPDWAANGIGETAMRAVSHLDKASNGHEGPQAKTTILLFPRSVDDLIQLSDHTQSPAWPGLRVLEATCHFFPSPDDWADPICPLFQFGSPPTEAPNLPSSQEIKFQIAATMRSAKRATACTNYKGLAKHWEKALDDVEAMEKDPTITWREERRIAPEQGSDRSHITYSYNNLNNYPLSLFSFLYFYVPSRRQEFIP